MKPSDPYAYMIEQLSAAQSKRATLAQIVSRPSSAAGFRPTPPSEPRHNTAGAGPQRPRPPEKELLHVEAQQPLQEPPPLFLAPNYPGLEAVRLQLKGRLEEAFKSGSLEEAVRAVEAPEAPEAPEAKTTTFADDVYGPDDEHLSLKVQMREVLEDAVEKLD